MFSIRQPHLGDTAWITLACQDFEIQRWTTIPRPYTTENAIAFIENQIGEAHIWVIEETSDLQAIGAIGIHQIDSATGTADIGYWVASWGRGRGAATAAILLVEHFSKSNPTIHKLNARIASTNFASQTVATRAGLVNAGCNNQTCKDGENQVPTLVFEKSIR